MSTRQRHGMRTVLAVATVGMTLAATSFSGKLAASPQAGLPDAAAGPAAPGRHGARLQPKQLYQVPLTFEVNQGQADRKVRFVAHSRGYSAYLSPSNLLLEVLDAQSTPIRHEASGRVKPQTGGRVWLRFGGANPHPELHGEAKLPGEVNYLLGSDQSQWKRHIQTFARVRYHNVYPGIDTVCYGNARKLEYDLQVAAGADAGRIRLEFAGTKALRLNASGDLLLDTRAGELRQRKPVVYQDVDGQRQTISGRYALLAGGRAARIELGPYDRTRPLVIDPELIGIEWSTFLGGGGADTAVGIATDGNGNAYVFGNTGSGTLSGTTPPFPTTNGTSGTLAAYSTTPDNLFISKFNSSGGLMYSTYFGAANNTEIAGNITVDTLGRVLICCSTESLGCSSSGAYPTTTGGFNQEGGDGWDGAVTQFVANGSSIQWSTLLPGSGADYATDVAVNNAGTIAWAVGRTSSTNFLTYAGGVTLRGYQTANGGGTYDAWLVVLNLSNTVGASPVHTSCFASNGKQNNVAALLYGTYLGGNGAEGTGGEGFGTNATVDQSLGVAIDNPNATLTSLGNAYIAGDTTSPLSKTGTAFPTTTGAFQTTDPGVVGTTGYGTQHAFVAKFNPALTGSSSLVYSTYLGGTGTDVALGVAADSAGNTYVTGYTNSTNFPTSANHSTTYPSIFPTYRGGSYDAFVTKLNPTGTAAIYSTYLGGNGQDSGSQIRSDAVGNAYIIGTTNTASAGATTSTDFPQAENYFPAPPATPTPANTIQVGYNGSTDFFITKLRPDGSGPNFSTYFGGSSYDYGTGIALDSSGNAYVCGYTSGAGFPTKNAYQSSYSANTDAAVAKFILNDPPTVSAISNVMQNCTGDSGASVSFTVTVGDSNADFLTVTLLDGSTPLSSTTVTGGTITPAVPQYIVNPTSGTVTLSGTFPVGTSTAVIQVTDGLDTVQTSATVNINDPNAPMFSPASPSTLNATLSGASCLDLLTLTPPTASDLCSASDPVTGTVAYDGPISGFSYSPNTIPMSDMFSFEAGVSTITWTATNPSGVTNSVTQTVVITDNSTPSWLTPVSTTNAAVTLFPEIDEVETMSGAGASVTVPVPTAMDNCDSTPTIYGFRDNPGLSDSGTPSDLSGTYPSGRSVITWLAIDDFFNIALAYQVVCVAPSGDSIQATFPSSQTTEGWVGGVGGAGFTWAGSSSNGSITNTTAGTASWAFASGSGLNNLGSLVTFNGNESWACNGTLTIGMFIASTSTGSTNNTLQNVIIQNSSAGSLSTPIGAPSTTLTLYTLNLNTNQGWTYTPMGGRPVTATAANIKTVLSGIQQIQIPGQWTLGNSFTTLTDVTLSGP